jgi:hypothetical protein
MAWPWCYLCGCRIKLEPSGDGMARVCLSCDDGLRALRAAAPGIVWYDPSCPDAPMAAPTDAA